MTKFEIKEILSQKIKIVLLVYIVALWTAHVIHHW